MFDGNVDKTIIFSSIKQGDKKLDNKHFHSNYLLQTYKYSCHRKLTIAFVILNTIQ